MHRCPPHPTSEGAFLAAASRAAPRRRRRCALHRTAARALAPISALPRFHSRGLGTPRRRPSALPRTELRLAATTWPRRVAAATTWPRRVAVADTARAEASAAVFAAAEERRAVEECIRPVGAVA